MPVRRFGLWLAAAATACGTANSAPPAERGKGGETAQCDANVYPCGPYGYQVGSTIENLSLVGRADTNGNGNFADDAPVSVSLADYHADKNVYALLVTASAEWCAPCQQEQPELKAYYEQMKAAGGHLAILEAIVQNKEGEPSDISVADRWQSRFSLPFVVTADPAGVLEPYYDVSAFPMNMVVRTSDMKIMWQSNGLDPENMKRQIAKVIASPYP